MIRHIDLEKMHIGLWQFIRQGWIKYGGNNRLKIYGTLSCQSGRRMKKGNRIFFSSEEEAIVLGFRPCGHCMRKSYLVWKEGEARLRHK
jgi:methylphosphotriester-DNA--protein-cysteine methyltransferase